MIKTRVKKLEEKCGTGERLVYPWGYYYGEPNSEPYWTNELVKDFTELYNGVEHRGAEDENKKQN